MNVLVALEKGLGEEGVGLVEGGSFAEEAVSFRVAFPRPLLEVVDCVFCMFINMLRRVFSHQQSAFI